MGSRTLVWGLLTLMLAGTAPAAARTEEGDRDRVDGARQARPLGEALAADGTLRTAPGLRASFDARGWRLAPGGGAPRFERVRPDTARAPEDARWSAAFSSPGTDDVIRAVAVRGSEVFVGGHFAAIGKAAASNVARWDGARWTALGAGVDGTVYSIAVAKKIVYVGGTFTRAGGAAASNVARWDGHAWSALGAGAGNGVSGPGAIVYAIAPLGKAVFVGGYFSKAGGVDAHNLARFDTKSKSWSEVSGGVRRTDPEDPSYVFAIAATKKTLYVGGKFDFAGPVAASHVAALDVKRGVWAALGAGANDWVTALALDGAGLYAGGFFNEIGGTPALHVARWDGSAWADLGGGLATDGAGLEGVRVKGLAVVGSSLYVAGYFTEAGGADARGAARWNGSSWDALAGGLQGGLRVEFPGDALALAAGPDAVYVAGGFDRAGAAQALGLARWSVAQSGWSALEDAGPHLGVYEGLVDVVAVDGETVYIGGAEMNVGGKVAFGIARWNGAEWSTLGSGAANGVDGIVSAIAPAGGGAVVVGGYFSHAGGVEARNVARWDGARWTALGGGVGGSADSQVFALAVDGASVYAAGVFPQAGAVAANNVARWNGSSWAALGSGAANGVDGPVFALAKAADGLYAGGLFAAAGGAPAKAVARWDGSSWSSLGLGAANGVDGGVFALAADGARVYVGGDFDLAGGAAASNVALWSGGAWSALGTGVTTAPGSDEPFDYVFTLALDGGRVVAGGYFDTAGGAAASNVAVWTGAAWEALGSGANDLVTSAGATPSGVYVGGAFALAGGKPSMRIARWSAQP